MLERTAERRAEMPVAQELLVSFILNYLFEHNLLMLTQIQQI